MDMDPCAFNLRIAVGAPHGFFPVCLDVSDHLLPGAVAAFCRFPGIINTIPPEMANVLMARLASHPARRALNFCCHDKALYESAKNEKFGVGALIVLT